MIEESDLGELYPFQKVIWETRNVFDSCTINFVHDTRSSDKATMATLCNTSGKGVYVVASSYMDMMNKCYKQCHNRMRDPSPICIEMPSQTTNKEKAGMVYHTVERIKDGLLDKTRGGYDQWAIDSPQLWVFSAVPPHMDLLPDHKWKVWTITQDNDLHELRPLRSPKDVQQTS